MRRPCFVFLTVVSITLAPISDVWAGRGGGFRGGGGGGGGVRGGGGFGGGAGGGGFRGGAGGGISGGNFAGNRGNSGGGNLEGGNFGGNRPGFENRPNQGGNFGERFPSAGNRLPNGGDRAPSGGNRLPNNGNRLPNSGNRLPNAGNRLPNSGDRLPNRGDRIDNRGDRIDNRGDRIDNRGDRINNRNQYWQNAHNNWYHGGWNGHWGYGAPYWYAHPWASWGITTAAVGLTSWAAGSLFYNTGYSSYSNPYYVQTSNVVQDPALNYSQPIDTTAALPAQDSPAATQAISESDEARNAFYQGDYNRALGFVDQALANTPSDTVLHEFRALVLFAQHNFKEAAAADYAVLSIGPGWDWTTMSSLYPNVSVYTEQLRALEKYVRENPEVPEGHFLLAYQYLCTGSQKAAGNQLEQVVKLLPNDQLSKHLLALTLPSDAQSPAVPPPTNTASNEPTGPRIQPGSLIGGWTAPATGGGTIEFSLAEGSSFTWKYARPEKTQQYAGKYDLAGDTLVLNYDNGGTMVGKISLASASGFTFKMLGGPPNDPGLTFAKGS